MMNLPPLLQIQLAMVAGLFLVGVLCFIIGVIVLLTRSIGRDVRALVTQSSYLAKKGLAEEVAGLVGNVSALLNATNELIRTTAGIGVFFMLLGVALMGIACWLVFRIN
ncbi:MAG: hypothetical protein P8X95_21165 [Anaerolineales bacterium]|jgi:hypothetical protein